jgi:3D (Asp-Asp-Asp) domain-containing protein
MKIVRLFYIFALFLALVFITDAVGAKGDVLGTSTYAGTDFTSNETAVETKTAFEQEEVTEYETIPFSTEYEENPDEEYGTEEVLRAGENGVRTLNYLVTHWLGDEIDRVLLSTEVDEPTTEIVSKGTKIIWGTFETPDGEIDYWYKMRVFATKYDSTCLGCNNTTALGAPVKQGVCAVDPKVISMYTHFYVPGYGKCQALDVGGLIKGNRIDLAYEDASVGSWTTRYTDIYLMDNPPY